MHSQLETPDGLVLMGADTQRRDGRGERVAFLRRVSPRSIRYSGCIVGTSGVRLASPQATNEALETESIANDPGGGRRGRFDLLDPSG